MRSKKTVIGKFEMEEVTEHVVCVRSDISGILRQLKGPMKEMSISYDDIVSISIRVMRPYKKEE